MSTGKKLWIHDRSQVSLSNKTEIQSSCCTDDAFADMYLLVCNKNIGRKDERKEQRSLEL